MRTVSPSTVLSVLVLSTVWSGCVSHVRHSFDGVQGGSARKVPATVDALRYTEAAEVRLTEADVRLRHHRVLGFRYGSVGENGQPGNAVEGLYFRSRKPGPKPVVLVFPIWGSHTYPPEKISRGYAKRSEGKAHVVRFFGADRLIDWEALTNTETEADFIATAKRMVRRTEVAVMDAMRFVDWLETRTEIDRERIGFVGFSLGAMVGAAFVGSDPRVDAAVFVMGGAEPSSVFGYCNGMAGETRDHVMRRFGWTRERYESFWAIQFAQTDPALLASGLDPNRVLVIDAANDDCVPKPARERFWEALGRPERVSFHYTHKRAFFSMTPLGFNYGRRLVYDHLDRVLAPPRDDVARVEEKTDSESR